MSMPMRWEQPVLPESPQSRPEVGLRRRRAARRAGMLRTTAMSAFRVTIGILAVLGLWSVSRSLRPEPSLRAVASGASGREMALGSATAERRLGYVTVTGNAVNHLSRRLSQVEAVVELLDSHNKPLRMESAMIAFDPIRPGDTAPFRVEIPDDSRAVGYRVRFKQLLGAALD